MSNIILASRKNHTYLEENKKKRSFWERWLPITVMVGTFCMHVENAQARLNPEVCAALQDASGMAPGPNRGVIDDFGVAPAMPFNLVDILYTAFANLLKTPAGRVNELTTITEAIYRAGGILPNSALTCLGNIITAVPAAGAALIGYAPNKPFMVIAVADALLAAAAPAAPAALPAAQAAAVTIRNLAGGAGAVPAIGVLAGAAGGGIAATLPAAAAALGAAAGVINPNPVSYSYNHMRDVRHLWQMPPVPLGVAAPPLDAHYLAWCRAARTGTGFPFPPEHSSFTLTVGAGAPNPQADFLIILNAIVAAAQNPANIIGVDPVVPGNAVDILVNVGPIPGINVIKCDLGAPAIPALLPNITDNATNVIAKTTVSIISPAPPLPAAPGVLPPNLVPALIPTIPAVPAAPVGAAVPPLMATAAAAPAKENAANSATTATMAAIVGLGAPPGVNNIIDALAFPVVNRNYGAIPNDIEHAAEAAATIHQARSTFVAAVAAGAAPAFLQLQGAVPAVPLVAAIPAAAIPAVLPALPPGGIPANMLVDAMATVNNAGAAVVPAALMVLLAAIPGGVAAGNLAVALNALPTLPAPGAALAVAAGAAATAAAPLPVGVVTVRISPSGIITSIFPK